VIQSSFKNRGIFSQMK